MRFKIKKKYCNRIKHSIPGDRCARKRIITLIRADIGEYLDMHPQASYEDLQAAFGTPEEYTHAFPINLDDSRFHRISQRKQFARRLLLSTALVTIVLASLLSAFAIHLIWGTPTTYSVEIDDYGIVVEDYEEYVGPVEGLVILPEGIQ